MENLTKIQALVGAEYAQFRQCWRTVLHSQVHLVNQITDYLISQNSKHLRPLLVMLSARLHGEPNEATIWAAVTVEILHTATLVHDDVVDESLQRRGQPSVNALWQNKIAVLLGDYLFSKSLQAMLKLQDVEALSLLARTSEELSAGELLQLEHAQNQSMTEETYYEMIKAKTASLFAASCRLGAMSVGAEEGQCNALYDYGLHLGMAFQIKDDLFDLVGVEYRIGKPTDRDLKSNLMTLPLIYTLRQLPDALAKEWRHRLAEGLDEEGLRQIKDLIESYGGIAYAERQMAVQAQAARDALQTYGDSIFKSALIELVEFNTRRTR